MTGNFAPSNPSIFGFWRYETVAAPAAGQNWTFTNGSNALRCVQAVRYLLVAGAAVADRYCGVVLKNQGSTIVMARYSQVAVTAAASVVWYADVNWPLTSTQDVPNRIIINDNLAPMWLNPGDTLSSDVLNLQAADGIAQIQIAVFAYQSFAT